MRRSHTNSYVLLEVCDVTFCFIFQQIGGDATLLFYGTEEGTEGKTAYLERRKPDFSRFPRLP